MALRWTLCTLMALAFAPFAAVATNTYPIILVHGFGGWGPNELLGFKYWGGIQGDLQAELVAAGYTVYTATVGPFSSNWDRACELYAQIKGGTVDYGANHSSHYGHNRYGSTFTGLYPAWGTTTNGKLNKVHLIGHSMGGQTIRMLAQMLEKGTTGAPVVETAPTNALFTGGKNWVHSITTISTPNQGTLLADGFSEIGSTVKTLLVDVLGVVGLAGTSTEDIYDAKLDQWNISPRGSSESLSTYMARIFSSSILQPGASKDISLWSLSTAGAKEENAWVTTLSNVYYFSYATEDTYATVNLLLQRIESPNLLTMLVPLDPLAIFMGGRYGPNNGFSTDWQENDGAVNTISMAKDSTGSSVSFSGTSVIGKWNIMTQLSGLDHLAVIGVTLLTQVESIYTAHAAVLYSLAADTTSTSRQLTDEAAMSAGSSLISAIATLNNALATLKNVTDLQTLCASPINTMAKNYCTSMIAKNSRRLNLRGSE